LGESVRWIDWRAERLVAAGFSADLAWKLAAERDVDLHEVLELVDRGCPAALAARIVAPLDPKSRFG
jgi:hypothetical protein